MPSLPHLPSSLGFARINRKSETMTGNGDTSHFAKKATAYSNVKPHTRLDFFLSFYARVSMTSHRRVCFRLIRRDNTQRKKKKKSKLFLKKNDKQKTTETSASSILRRVAYPTFVVRGILMVLYACNEWRLTSRPPVTPDEDISLFQFCTMLH